MSCGYQLTKTRLQLAGWLLYIGSLDMTWKSLFFNQKEFCFTNYEKLILFTIKRKCFPNTCIYLIHVYDKTYAIFSAPCFLVVTLVSSMLVLFMWLWLDFQMHRIPWPSIDILIQSSPVNVTPVSVTLFWQILQYCNTISQSA